MDLTTENYDCYGLVGIAFGIVETEMGGVTPHVEAPGSPEGNKNELGGITCSRSIGVNFGLPILRLGLKGFRAFLDGE